MVGGEVDGEGLLGWKSERVCHSPSAIRSMICSRVRLRPVFVRRVLGGVEFGGEDEGVEQGGIAWGEGSFDFVEESLAGKGPFFCFGVVENGVELGVGKAGENGDVDGLLSVVVGEGEGSFLEGQAAEGFIEIKMVEGDETREGQIALGQGLLRYGRCFPDGAAIPDRVEGNRSEGAGHLWRGHRGWVRALSSMASASCLSLRTK